MRGIALFGILLGNITFFAMPGGVAGDWWRQTHPGTVDLAATFAIRGIFENSFILVFSFLFGYGAARQLERGDAPFRRRLLGLAVIGILHGLLLWPGDILLAYALIGLVLPFATGWPTRRILRVIGLLWLTAILGNTLVGGMLVLLDPPPLDAAAMIALYRDGGYLGILQLRLVEWAEFYGFGLLVLMPLIAAAVLLGVAAKRWLAGRPPSQLRRFTPAIVYFLAWPAILGSVAYGALATYPNDGAAKALLAPEIIMRALFSPLLAALLTALLLHLFALPAAARAIRPLSVNGQLSLSTYVGQSLVCVLLFHGYGAGLYGRVGPAECILIAVAIFGVMTGLAMLWHHFAGRGPLERVVDLFVQPASTARQAALEASRPPL
jgi:uncharacterized protein